MDLLLDDVSGRLSHSKLINLLGAFTGSVLMFVLLSVDKMSEGYFGIYMTAVGLTAVGYRYATRPRHTHQHEDDDNVDWNSSGRAKAIE